MPFSDRIDAAEQLVPALAAYRGSHPLILAIPRGALELGPTLAKALDGELDVILVRKLRAPFSPEFAIGAIDETGWTYVAPYADSTGADERYLEQEKAEQLAILKQRRTQYTPARPAIDPAGRTVIVIDDGLATGATMLAALHAVRARRPATLVCAVPVAAPDSLALVQAYADELVVLEAPENFHAVGQFYASFRQLDDTEAIALLTQSLQHKG